MSRERRCTIACEHAVLPSVPCRTGSVRIGSEKRWVQTRGSLTLVANLGFRTRKKSTLCAAKESLRWKFLVVATDTAHRHVETCMKRRAEDDECHAFTIRDPTGAFAQLNVQGPRSRELMSSITSHDMSDE
mmetsp:Transcript_43886/g.86078  ORF Transcript_43886/g.86078 Transcript_43886/m.86078 type:complete len:131 (+) Transcript_43886:1044-1436(+)